MPRKMSSLINQVGKDSNRLKIQTTNRENACFFKTGKFCCETFWKFGVLVPHVHSQARELDKQNGKSKWNEAEDTEKNQLLEDNAFIDKGIGGEAPAGYKR
jgi:hypothetical protein